MRHYQNKRKNPYFLPHNVYMQMLYIINDYNRLCKERLEILYSSPPPSDGQPRGGNISDTTAAKAIRLAKVDEETHCIDDVLNELRGEYSAKTYVEFNPYIAFDDEGYFNYMHKRDENNPNDIGPSNRTWKRYRSKLAFKLAKKLSKA